MRLTISAVLILACTATAPSSSAQEVRPSHRFGHTAAFDAARGRVVLFGGLNAEEQLTLHDTWEFDGRRWHRLTPDVVPSARAFAAMAYDAARNRVVLFGGATETEAFTDTWEWDGRVWTERPESGPPARMMASMIYDPAGQRVLLLGGMHPQSEEPYNDLWAWDGNAWTALDEGVEYAGMTPTEATRQQAYRAVLIADLRNLATAQEMYFADNVTYVTSLDELGDMFTPSMGVTITIVSGSAQGWSALAVHEQVPDARCAMWVGTAEPLLDGGEGEAVCEGLEN